MIRIAAAAVAVVARGIAIIGATGIKIIQTRAQQINL